MNAQNPQPNWVKVPKAPTPDISYAHKNGRGMLTPWQVEQLLMAINPAYVSGKQGKTYLAQHQARAEMNRIFGYGSWDGEALEATLLYENQEQGTGPNASKLYWVTGYRVLYRVTVRDLWGMPLATYTEYHAEENAKLPNRGEAHAFALTSCESYALRRALINLGDRFGLGLYNGGSTAVHGGYTVQNQPGVLFDWKDANQMEGPAAPVAQAPFAQPTHTTIQAEKAIADDEASNYELAEGAPPAAAPRGTKAQQKRENFHNAQARVREGNMAARIQAGMKVDQSGDLPPEGEYPRPDDQGDGR